MEDQNFNNLKRKVEELEKSFRFHNHYGYDVTRLIDGHIKMKKDKILQIGMTYLANANLHDGLANETNRLLLTTGLDDKLEFGYKTGNTQVQIEHQKNTALSFLYGFRPPLYSGPKQGSTIGITAAGNTISDTNQTFVTNELAGAYISIVGVTTGTLETHVIASNTATQITIADTWGITENVIYVAFVPMYLGAANYPWQRMYLIGDLRFGKGASAGSGVIYIKYGSGSPAGVITANIGSVYLRMDGGAGTSLYIKESGTGNTGWTALGGSGFTSKMRAYGAAQSIANNTETVIQFGTENYDIGSEYNTGTYRFTATVAGYYIVNVQSGIDDVTVDKTVVVYIYKNAGLYTANQVTSNAFSVPRIFLTDIIPLAAGDFIEAHILHNFGVAKDTLAGTASNFMAIHRLS